MKIRSSSWSSVRGPMIAAVIVGSSRTKRERELLQRQARLGGDAGQLIDECVLLDADGLVAVVEVVGLAQRA